jgi:hypothetical protein
MLGDSRWLLLDEGSTKRLGVEAIMEENLDY